mmetsp:Transcript_31159/g.54163  ORF Transcript_31159/g.54163 Transcript_31159/m.54163 type:complete len:170 (-) Transcript_31159:85-594(-)
MSLTVQDLIQIYDLQPHPEGGFFKETYVSSHAVDVKANEFSAGGTRWSSTHIFYLLPGGSRSKIHRLTLGDEMWHFYLGGPLTVAEMSPDGQVKETILGQDVKAGHATTTLVPVGNWFGAYANEGTEFALVGCTVTPGFDFKDFEFGSRGDLLAKYPHAREIILWLTDE